MQHEAVGAVFAVVQLDVIVAGRVARRRRHFAVAHVDGEGAGRKLAGRRCHFLQHQPARLGLDGVDRLAGRVA